MRVVLLAILLQVLSVSVRAQLSSTLLERYNMSCLDLTSGLPHDHVNHIFVDSQGFVWVSSYGGGAVRYDGYSFKAPNQVDSRSCLGFAEDRHQRLWIAYDEGTIVIDLNTMRRVVPSFGEQDISSLLLRSSVKVYCDSKGALWQVARDSIFRYEFADDGSISSISRCRYQGNTPDIAIRDVDNNGHVWVSTSLGLSRITVTGHTLKLNPIHPILQKLKGLFVTDMLKHDNAVWISTNQGLYAYDSYSSELRHYPHTSDGHSLSHNHATALAIAPDGRLLVGTLRGLDIMNKDNGTFEHWNSTSDKHPMPSDFIDCLLTMNGQIWIGTETAGIVKLTPRPFLMRNHVHQPQRAGSLSAHPVNAMCIDNHGVLWAGTVEGGLNRMESDGTFTHWTTQNAPLSHNSVSVLEPDDEGRIWIGTWGGGLNMITTDSHPTLRHISMPASLIPITNYIGALAYDKRNNALWIGSNDGVYLYNLATGELENPFVNNNLIRGCIGAHIDRNGQLWMGSLLGLCIVDLKSGRDKNGHFKNRALRHKLDNPRSPVIDKICCFCETRDGTLWLGSNGYGLYRRIVDKRTGKETFKVLTTDDGLANNSVKGIVEDLQGRLWITTNNGLSVYDPSTRSFRNYGEYDGLPSQRFYWNSAIKGADKTLYLGSVDGICEVKGGNSEAIIPTHLTFTRLFVNNVPVVAGSDFIDADISQTDCIHLHESDRSFAVEFSSLTYGSESHGYYSYRLVGFENEWTALRPGEHSVRYTSLKPGNYSLEVRFMDGSQDVDEQIVSVDVVVAPYFWKSWWFLLFTLAVLGVLFWWLYQQRLRAWRRQEAEKLLIPIKKVLDESDAPEQLQVRIQTILDNQERITKSRHRSVETDKQQTKPAKDFMERATDILEHHYMDSQFDVTEFADAMGMSKSLLAKRIKEETGQSSSQFIRNYRLSVARDLILENYANRNIMEIAYKVGFNDPKYFTRCFTRFYGIAPSLYK